MEISRSVDSQSSPATVHAYLADLNQYPKWNPFSESDPGATNVITGTGIGSYLTWKGDKTGEGKTRMTWSMHQELTYLKRYFGLMSGSMGKTFERGLDNLKKQLEKT